MKNSAKLLLNCTGGMIVGLVVGERLFMRDMNMPWQVKTGLLIFFFVSLFYYFLTHRTPDKERLDLSDLAPPPMTPVLLGFLAALGGVGAAWFKFAWVANAPPTVQIFATVLLWAIFAKVLLALRRLGVWLTSM